MPTEPGPTAVKKRRLQGACDICRLKKVKCDSGNMPGGVCSNCIAFSWKCTHLTGKRAQAKAISGITPSQLDPLLLAGENLTGRPPLLNLEDGTVQNTLIEFCEYIKVLEARLSSEDTSEPEPEMPEDQEDTTDAVLANHMNIMSMSTSRDRFYAKSSNVVLRKAASGVISKAGLRSRPTAKRMEMCDLYFMHYNILRPLLHRPSFEKSLHEGLHHRNYYFGATVLVVCALGSKFSDDRRVFLDGVETEQSCGWSFFSQACRPVASVIALIRIRQVQPLQGTSLAAPPSLHELQYYCLSVIFLHGSSVIETSWAVLGITLRLAQDLGLYKKMAGESEATADNESWKRIFWCLVALDPPTSSSFGRPPGLNSDDFDQEYPLECDDEYWVQSDPEQAFKQPPHRPSKISSFIFYIKLIGILEMTQRTLYAANSPISRKQAVLQLNEAMAKWLKSVPEHLRWDPHGKDLVFFKQSGCLYTTYYYIKMLVHQPALLCTLSNLAISVEAAKRCIDVLEHLSRKSRLSVPIVQIIIFSCAATLLINRWKNPSESKNDLDDVRRCLKLLKSQETRWQIAGRFWDTVSRLLSHADQYGSRCAQVGNRKRSQQESCASGPSDSHPSWIALQVQPPNLSYPTLPSLNLPTDTTESEIERLLLSTTLPDLEAMEHWGRFLDLPGPENWNV
ncbi:fungal-specific transcription factor domain-containing protein [Mycena floridula]|nr:fungal-specific transcription factor domain-containing protein [Mycena floridula]